MKLFIWNNGNSQSDYQPVANIEMDSLGSYSSDAHSGGIVVLASDIESATAIIAYQRAKHKQNTDLEYLKNSHPKIIDPSKVDGGILLYADGDC